MDFRSLETFVAVVALGSFRRAATRLHTTQPAVSQRIARLEADLGRRLLDRQKRAVVPTEAGRRLLDYADRILRLRSELTAALADPSAVAGTLRLGVAESIVHTWLPGFVERMSRVYPSLLLEIDVDISPNLQSRLIEQDLDLAFLVGPLSAPALKSRPLCTFPVAFLASPALGLEDREIQPTELAERPIITFARNSQPYIAVREAFAAPDLPPLRVHASASVATIVRMTIDGLGIAAMPPAIVAGELATGRVHVVRTPVSLDALDFVAAWRATPHGGLPQTVAAIAADVAHGGAA